MVSVATALDPRISSVFDLNPLYDRYPSRGVHDAGLAPNLVDEPAKKREETIQTISWDYPGGIEQPSEIGGTAPGHGLVQRPPSERLITFGDTGAIQSQGSGAVWFSSSRFTEVSPYRYPLPSPDVTPEAKSYLRDPQMKFVFDRLVTMCVNHVIMMGVPLERLTLSTKTSREERWLELVLRIFVPLNIPQSLALWDAIGDGLHRWSRRLPLRQQNIIAEQFAVFVEPS